MNLNLAKAQLAQANLLLLAKAVGGLGTKGGTTYARTAPTVPQAAPTSKGAEAPPAAIKAPAPPQPPAAATAPRPPAPPKMKTVGGVNTPGSIL